jgi:hypothetical protein
MKKINQGSHLTSYKQIQADVFLSKSRLPFFQKIPTQQIILKATQLISCLEK